LSENQLGGDLFNGNLIHLGEALKSNNSLIYLNLSGNNITFFEVNPLKSGLEANQTLTHLDLSSNQIGFFGMAMMMQALQIKRVLTHLDLHSNQIECNNAKRIKALKTLLQNCALIELDLSENQITEEAQPAIKEVEESKPGLQVKVTFSEFCEKQIESLEEEEL
nr:hypothetical protein [Candidatus Anoxychlamydiales bacterium]